MLYDDQSTPYLNQAMADFSWRSAMRKTPRRPFANAHWSLLAGLILAGQVWLLTSPCSQSGPTIGIALGTFVCVLALWVNHVRVAPLRDWRDALILFGGALYDLFLTGLLFVLISLTLPSLDCNTPRDKVSEMMFKVLPLREEISARIEQKHSLTGVGEGLNLGETGFVTQDGSIVMTLEKPVAVVVQQPNYTNGAVSWTCVGAPTQYMPLPCRPKSP
ncbi:MAG: hypothetical protein IPL70_01835 [Uliginosibacterium sp.]|jgi:hypothetical protein|nr:hypothetical protein [Uliginosibacterium sp.]